MVQEIKRQIVAASVVIQVCHGEERAEPKGEVVDLLVDLRFYPDLCPQAVVSSKRTRLWVQVEMSFLHRVAKLTLRDKIRLEAWSLGRSSE